MDNLRPATSPRPSIVVDDAANRLADPASNSVGKPGPLGRSRVLFALPLDPGPALVSPPYLVRDDSTGNLADPNQAIIGYPAVWVSRMLTANWTEDTRRL